MNITIFGKSHFDKITLEKQAAESFCANHLILPFKVCSAILWCFEKMIYREFSGWIKAIILYISKQPEREFGFIIPIEKSAFLTAKIAESNCRSGFAHRI